MLGFVLAVAAAQSLPSHEYYATSVTTLDVVRACAKSESDPTVEDFCSGYITATFDALSVNGLICSREGVSTPQIIAIARREIKDNPQLWDKQPGWIIGQAFKREFRCSKFQTDPLPPDPYLTIDAVVRATAEAIEETAAGRQVDLVGISYGGMVACRVAASCPSLVRRIVLVSSAHRFSRQGEDHVRRQIALLENGDMAGFAKAFTGLFRRPVLNWLIGLTITFRRRRVLSAMAQAELIVRYLKAMLSAGPADLTTICKPVLLIGGSADQFFGDGIMEKAAAGMPSAELYSLDGETHTAPVERAQAFKVKIGDFLSPG